MESLCNDRQVGVKNESNRQNSKVWFDYRNQDYDNQNNPEKQQHFVCREDKVTQHRQTKQKGTNQYRIEFPRVIDGNWLLCSRLSVRRVHS